MALSLMILQRNLETTAQYPRETPSPPPPPPSTSPSTVQTEFTAYSESSALFADCLEGPPLRVLPAAVASNKTVGAEVRTRGEVLPQLELVGTILPQTAGNVAEPAPIKFPEPGADMLHNAVDQVRIVNSRRPRSPRSPTLLSGKGNSAFVRPKAI